MALTKDNLDKYLTRNNVYSEVLGFWYGFNASSGHVLFNEKYSDPLESSLVDVTGLNERCVNNLSNPMYLIGSGSNSFSFAGGSGYFDSESILKLGNSFFTGSDGFTIIANLGNFDNEQNLDKGKTLFTTMKNSSDVSGFSVGINGLNRVYFHYAGIDGEVDRSISAENELNNYCVFSIGCRPYYSSVEAVPIYSNGVKVGDEKIRTVRDSYFDYSYHDITNISPNAQSDWSMFACEGCVNFNPSDSFYVGDFFTPSEGYTGYKGHLLDLLVFSGVLSPEQRHDISKAFFVENIIPPHFAQKYIQESVVTGSGVFSIGITGTGITGYENVQVTKPLLTRSDDVIGEICSTIRSGVEGPLSGEIATFETSTGVINRAVTEFVPEVIEYSAEAYRSHSKRTLVFSEPIDSNDIYEIHSYTGRSDRVNRQIPINMTSAMSDWDKDPIINCKDYAKAICTAQSWTGKVCYPCNKYIGEAGCGDCYKVAGVVDAGCGEDDTCESGFASTGECRSFIFDECLKRTDSPIGSFNLKRTIMPSQEGFNPYVNRYVSDLEYLTSGGNLFINGILSKLGEEVCETGYLFQSHGTQNSNLTEICNLKSGKYIIKEGHNGYYSGNHSFSIRLGYDFYGEDGERLFSDGYRYVMPSDEFGIFDDSFDDGLDGPAPAPPSSPGIALFHNYVTGQGNLSFVGPQFLNKDIYLNGQKLISGLHYIPTSNQQGINIDRSELPLIEDAQLAFVTVPIHVNTITGTDAGSHKKFDFDLLSEKVWINGIRQAEGIDYIKVSDASALKGATLKSKPDVIYNNSKNFFNDEIQTGFKV